MKLDVGGTTVDIEGALAEREKELRFQRAVAACARALLSRHASDHVGDALDALLDASDATSLFVAKNIEHPVEGFCSNLVYESEKGGVVTDVSQWVLVPWSRLPDSGAALARGEPFVFRQGDFGPIEGRMRDGSEVKAGAQFPIFLGDRWAGLVGFVDRKVERDWSDNDLRLLQAASEMFARLWERQEQQELLEASVAGIRKRLDYERALAECSRALLTSSDKSALEWLLDALVEVTEARFGLIAINVEDPELGPCSQALCRSEVVEPGAPPSHGFDEYWFRVPWSRQPELYERLSSGRSFAYRVADLGRVERELYAGSPAPTSSVVAIPIMTGAEWRGMLAYGYSGVHDVHAEEDVAMMRTAADMIAAFWLRQDAQHELEELVRSKDEFLAAVSHELRTPLTAVLGLAEELRDRGEGWSTSERMQVTALIAEQGLEMAHLVDDLLVAARGDFSSIELDLVSFDVGKEVPRIASGLGGGPIEVDIAGACLAVADAMRVRQILRNLITNALRYGGPSVRVGCAGFEETVGIFVSDDGPEIEPVARERIFEPYQRAHEDPTQPASVGLGLTVSRRLARLMGGDLAYRRESGRNVFELTLPRYRRT